MHEDAKVGENSIILWVRLDGGLYLMSIYESSLAVRYFSPTVLMFVVARWKLKTCRPKSSQLTPEPPKMRKNQNILWTSLLHYHRNHVLSGNTSTTSRGSSSVQAGMSSSENECRARWWDRDVADLHEDILRDTDEALTCADGA